MQLLQLLIIRLTLIYHDHNMIVIDFDDRDIYHQIKNFFILIYLFIIW